MSLVCLATMTGAQTTVTTTGGTVNVVPLYSGATTIVNSNIFQSGSNIGVGTSSPASLLTVGGTLAVTGTSILANGLRFYSASSKDGNTSFADFRASAASGNLTINPKSGGLYLNWDHGAGGVVFGNGSSGAVASISGAGNATFYGTGSSSFAGSLGIGTATPSQKLEVNGKVMVDGNINLSGTIQSGSGVPLVNVSATSSNIAIGVGSLSAVTTGADDLAIGPYALQANSTGEGNLALGFYSLQSNTTGGWNTAVGGVALVANISGNNNTALGIQAAASNTSGSGNTALGGAALFRNSTGTGNTAVGEGALVQATGSGNTAVGNSALPSNTLGSYNVALGDLAGTDGSTKTTGSYNIYLGYLVLSGASDNGIVRIGNPTYQTATFIAGIRGVTTGNSDAVHVYIDSNGQLGTVSSSRRFKKDVSDMGDATSNLMQLRPVTFRYKQPFVDGSEPIQYGLIAEEVAEVYPELVVRSADGQIETVKYQVLDSMLLNEVKKLYHENAAQKDKIKDLEERLSRLESALERSGLLPSSN